MLLHATKVAPLPQINPNAPLLRYDAVLLLFYLKIDGNRDNKYTVDIVHLFNDGVMFYIL
jgi:hypothetical protein